jgi:hypothetical protein
MWHVAIDAILSDLRAQLPTHQKRLARHRKIREGRCLAIDESSRETDAKREQTQFSALHQILPPMSPYGIY